MKFDYVKRVKYYETDKMGVVHHSNYIRWFEEARVEYLRAAGVSYKVMEEQKIMIPVVSVTCKYKSPATFDDEVVCTTWERKYNGIVIELEYEVRNKETGKLLVTGESSHCFVDSETFKPIYLKKERPDINEKFQAVLEEN